MGFAYRVPIGDYNYLQWTNYSCPHNFEAYFLCYRWSDLWSKFRLIHNRAQYSCSLNSQPFLPVNANDTQIIINIISRFFQFLFLFRKSEKTVSNCRGYKFLAESSNYWQSMIFLVLSHSLEKVKKKKLVTPGKNVHLCDEILRDHPYVTSANGLGGCVGGFRKWQFLLVQNYIYADIVGGWVWKCPKMCWRNLGMVPRMWHHKDWTVSAKILFSK